jgi:glycosyltransferase involved in cell wall biosynthesis
MGFAAGSEKPSSNNPALSMRAKEMSMEPARRPRVSVVMPAYNSAATVKDAIESVLAQTYPDFEIVVIDDGSVDDTERVVRQFGDRVRYFKQENGGVSVARNTGIKKSLGTYVAFLDSDDIWVPGKLAEQIPWLEADPKVGLVYCDWAVTSGEAVLQSSRHKELPAASGYVFDELIQSGFILTSGVIVRRACLDDVGDFDTSLAIAEDYDLWLRISYRWKLQLVDQCLLTKRSWDGSLSSNLKSTALARIMLFKKALKELPGMTSRSRKLMRRQLALSYWDVGYDEFDGLSFREARKNFMQSLAYDWTNTKSLAYLAAAYLPTSFVRVARAAKRANG